MNKRILYILLIYLSISSSCAMLPVEEEVLPPPIIKSYERIEYNYVTVEKGDLTSYKDISVNYVPALEERLSFPIGDIVIRNIYVKVGDNVKSGQILAELDKTALKKELTEAEYSLEKIQLMTRQLDETYILDRKSLYLSNSDQSQLNYDKSKLDLQSQQEIIEVRIAELKKQMEERTIRAGINGTITSVKTLTEGDRSVENERLIVVSDKSLSIFTTSGTDSMFFDIGQVVDVKISGSTDYEAVATDPKELGIDNPKEDSIYFVLTDPTASIRDNSYGSIRVTLDEKKNAVYVAQKAVHNTGDQSFVYMLEDNVKIMRNVEIGIATDGVIEITDGLKEGDLVIESEL